MAAGSLTLISSLRARWTTLKPHLTRFFPNLNDPVADTERINSRIVREMEHLKTLQAKRDALRRLDALRQTVAGVQTEINELRHPKAKPDKKELSKWQ